MNKVFLYLYPIKEYTKMFLSHDEFEAKKALSVLNECIQKRYRDNGYNVVFAIYPDKEIFGITPKKDDKIIFTDVTFYEAISCAENGNTKNNLYPNEQLLISQLENINKLVIGGYHAQDCVKRVGEAALNMGIDTIVDLDLTDLFFILYKSTDYFKIEEYDPNRYKDYIVKKYSRYGEEFTLKHFNEIYSSSVYGFNERIEKVRK